MHRRARELFKSTRESLGRGQEFFEQLGVSQGTISKIEADPHYNPRIETLQKALGGINHTIISFFTELERTQEDTKVSVSEALTPQQIETDNRPTSLSVPPFGGGDVGAGVLAEIDPVTLDAIGHALVQAGTWILGYRAELTESREQISRPRRKKPAHGARRTGNR